MTSVVPYTHYSATHLNNGASRTVVVCLERHDRDKGLALTLFLRWLENPILVEGVLP